MDAAATDQRWELTAQGTVVNLLSGLCLTPNVVPSTPNPTLELQTCSSNETTEGANQIFEFDNHFIRHVGTGMCIAADGGLPDDAKLWSCKPENAQSDRGVWHFVDVDHAALGQICCEICGSDSRTLMWTLQPDLKCVCTPWSGIYGGLRSRSNAIAGFVREIEKLPQQTMWKATSLVHSVLAPAFQAADRRENASEPVIDLSFSFLSEDNISLSPSLSLYTIYIYTYVYIYIHIIYIYIYINIYLFMYL